MARSFDDYSDDDPLDEHGLLKDGHRFRTPMHLQDSVQRAIARDRMRVVDGAGNEGLALRRPGSRMPADEFAFDEAAGAYAEMVRDGENAWKRGLARAPVHAALIGVGTPIFGTPEFWAPNLWALQNPDTVSLFHNC
jgi:hypothetical protein